MPGPVGRSGEAGERKKRGGEAGLERRLAKRQVDRWLVGFLRVPSLHYGSLGLAPHVVRGIAAHAPRILGICDINHAAPLEPDGTYISRENRGSDSPTRPASQNET